MVNQEPTSLPQTEDQPAIRQADVVSEGHAPLMIASAEMMSGPLPPPRTLQEYETIILGAANRIFEMADRQSEHRIQLEKAVVNGDSRRSYLAMTAAFILSALVIGGGIYLVATGHNWAGASLIGMNLVGLAGIFVYGSRVRS